MSEALTTPSSFASPGRMSRRRVKVAMFALEIVTVIRSALVTGIASVIV